MQTLNEKACVFGTSLQIIHILKYVDDNCVNVKVLLHLTNIPHLVHMVP